MCTIKHWKWCTWHRKVFSPKNSSKLNKFLHSEVNLLLQHLRFDYVEYTIGILLHYRWYAIIVSNIRYNVMHLRFSPTTLWRLSETVSVEVCLGRSTWFLLSFVVLLSSLSPIHGNSASIGVLQCCLQQFKELTWSNIKIERYTRVTDNKEPIPLAKEYLNFKIF